MSLEKQLEKRALACPVSRTPLVWSEHSFLSSAEGRKYPVIAGRPILLGNPERIEEELRSFPDLKEHYEHQGISQPDSFIRRIRNKISYWIHRDYKSKLFSSTFEEFFKDHGGKLIVSVGGGPIRSHPSVVNLNIGLFPNVDIVGDAYGLPYCDETVDSIYCDAVLEHLSDPESAIQEFKRVLKKGGQIFAITPFMQAYHGYPNHYQNYTLTGHSLLFEKKALRFLAPALRQGHVSHSLIY